jgi:hypothetical protein
VAGVEQVHHRKGLVHADQRFGVGRQRSANEREMRRIGDLVAIHDEPKGPVHRCERALGDAFDEALGAAAILNQVGDGSDPEPVLRREAFEVGQTRHRPVGVHDLAEYGTRREPCELGEVAARLSMPCAHENPTGL